MFRSKSRRLILVPMLSLTLLALTGCGASKNSEATPTAKATASASVTSDVFVSECGYGYSQKPSSITLTCADGGMYIDHITYSSWTSNSANGTGIFNENNCDPDCASGKFIKTKVSLMIDGPKKDSAGKLIFSNLNITATTKLYNGSKTASFDIWIEPETSDGSSSSQESSADQIDPQQATIDLIDRLNTESDLWQVNELATSDAGQMAHKRLGLYSEPDYVIECNLSYSGTWLFVYSDTNAAYDAFNSDYFFRTSSYSAKLMYDPQTNLIVILHTSMGGNRTCLNSAYKELEYYATDSN